ncbi:MAG: DUF4365 domain-containing protein [Clostridiaceae bacterium]|nr:DUF4365 domain-containing protein [Clostridiaceae bacterium]
MEKDEVCEIAVTDIASRLAKMNIVQYRTKRDVIGIDAYYEIFGDEESNGLLFAAQIKGGKSYIKDKRCYYYDIEKKHIETWRKFGIPVFLFINDPDEEKSYWIDIQQCIISNPQNEKVGYSFEFFKDGNELNKKSREKIINIVKARAGKLNSALERANYQYNSFLELSKSFIKEYKGISFDEDKIFFWLLSKGFKDSNEKFFNLVFSCINDYVNGIGILGRLINDDEVVEISVFRDKLFIENKDGSRDFINSNLNYDFEKALNYFKKYTKEFTGYGELCNFNEIEVIIFDGPLVKPQKIFVHKKRESINLYMCNIKGKINERCNDLIKRMINNRKNILFVGPKNREPESILSAITSQFDKKDRVVVIEDRRTINVLNGSPVFLTANSFQEDVLYQKIKEGMLIQSDRLIFDIGNFSINIPIKEILNCFGQRKGSIALLGYDSSLIKDIRKDLQFIILENNQNTSEDEIVSLINNIDYVIKLNFYFDRNSYLGEVWENEQNNWNKIFEYHPHEDNN